MVDSQEESTRTLETVSRACSVIRALEKLEGAGVTELADEVGISKSSAHAYLSTLTENQIVVKREDGSYDLSLDLLYLGNTVQYQHPLFEYGKKQADALADETEEYVHLMCEQHGLERNVYKVTGPRAVGDEYHANKNQRPDYLHFTSAGKAVLSQLPPDRVEEIVETHGLVSKTANTITDPDHLFEELARIRAQEYAVNDEEEIMGIRAVGAPICNSSGTVLGAISVSGPTSRFSGEFYRETLPNLIVEKANIIEANINMAEKSDEL